MKSYRLIVPILLASSTQGQTAVEPPSFEVAEINRATPPADFQVRGEPLPGGRIELYGMTAKDLIMFAYGVQGNMVIGAPKWPEGDHFDLIAKRPPDTPLDSVRPMLQALLADRLKLVVHREDKVLPVYVLTLGKRPLKLQRDSGGPDGTCRWKAPDAGSMGRECLNLTMAELTRQLPGLGGAGIDSLVVEQTGLKGSYDFQFDIGPPEKDDGDGVSPAPPSGSGPTIFDAWSRSD
jgi:uncharacterized protein (TIGR03435 family)